MKHKFLTEEELSNIKVGDVIERMLGFSIPMYLKVSEITEKEIITGPWVFDKKQD